jgi:iron complex outermembrane receptor protein
MKKTLLFTFLFFASFLHSQQYQVSGNLKLNKEGKPGVTVLLFEKEKDNLYKSAVTQKEGNFAFSGVVSGSYIVKVELADYDFYQEEIAVGAADVTVAPIALNKKKANELAEVVVKRPLIQVLADKTVFNVQNTINATGSSGFELLRKAPGVIVDNNDNLIVEGKSGVLIYIDGRQSYLTGTDLSNFLKTLQANDIDSIEIITQPSSKYDAAGNAGIVNIKLKKNKNFGTNGSASTGINVGKYVTSISSLSLNNRNKKSNIYGNYSNRFGNNHNFININREQSGKIFDSKSKTKDNPNANNLKLGYDYYATRTSTFGIILTGNFNNSFSNMKTRTQIRPVNSFINDSILIAKNEGHTKTYNVYSNLNYKFSDTTGVSLNVDLDYGKYDNKDLKYQPNTYYLNDEITPLTVNNSLQDTKVAVDIATLKADYERKLWKGKLSFGAKVSFVKTDNNLDFFNEAAGGIMSLNLNRTNQFIYKENVNAGYVNYNFTIKKFNLQAGLRVENTVSDGKLNALVASNNQEVKRNYTDYFPSGGITYQATPKNSLALIYSKRIERPNYQSLNPFEYQLDELSYHKGNPFLKPQYTDNIKISHTYNYKLTTSFSYTYINDFFAQVIEASGPSKSFLNSKNVANQQVLNLGVSYPFDVNKWWSVYMSVNAFQSKYISTDPAFVSTRQETVSLYGQNNFKLPQGINLEISGWYSSPSVWGGTFKTKNMGSLDIAFQKQFLNKKLTTRLAFSDVLYTSGWYGITKVNNLRNEANGGRDSRQVRFNLSYNFGSDAIKKSRERKTGLEDEKTRIGG